MSPSNHIKGQPLARLACALLSCALLSCLMIGLCTDGVFAQPPPAPPSMPAYGPTAPMPTAEPSPSFPGIDWGTPGDPHEATGVLNDVVEKFHAQARSWGGTLTSAASRLFWLLAAISLAWTFASMVLARADLVAFFVEFVRFAFFTGVYYWMLEQGPRNAVLIINSMFALAGRAGNPESDAFHEGLREPSDFIDTGFALLSATIESINWLDITGLPKAIVLMLLAMAVLVVLTLIAANMLSLLIAAWILAYGGIFFLGFGGARWTSDMAVNYYKSVLALGAQAYGMVLVAAIGIGVLRQQIATVSTGRLEIWHLAVALVVVLMMDSLIKKIPPMLGALTGGVAGPQWGRPHGFAATLKEVSAKTQFAAKSSVAPYSIISRFKGK